MKTIFERTRTKRVSRIAVDFPAVLEWQKNRIRCRSRQLSEFGIIVECDEEHLVGEQVQVKFMLDADLPTISLSATVAYAIAGGMGMRFQSTTPEQQNILNDYVQSRGIGAKARSSGLPRRSAVLEFPALSSAS